MMDILSGFAFGFGSIILFVLLPVALLAVGIPYAVIRMRDTKSELKDPELGLKVAYSFLFSAGFVLMLTGLTVNAADLIIGDGGGKNNQPAMRPGGFGMPMPQPPVNNDGKLLTPAMRIGWGLASAGLLFSIAFGLVMIFGTNSNRYPSARRVYVGARLTLAGLLVMSAVTTLLLWAFQKETNNNNMYEIAIAILCVWLPTLVIHIFLMRQYGNVGYFVPPPIETKRKRIREEEDDDEEEDEKPRKVKPVIAPKPEE